MKYGCVSCKRVRYNVEDMGERACDECCKQLQELTAVYHLALAHEPSWGTLNRPKIMLKLLHFYVMNGGGDAPPNWVKAKLTELGERMMKR